MIFFRNLSEGDAEALADVVHQTTMYYQDRLSGEGFARVLPRRCRANAPGRSTSRRRSLEERLGVACSRSIRRSAAPLTDRISATPDLMAMLGPAHRHVAAHAGGSGGVRDAEDQPFDAALLQRHDRPRRTRHSVRSS